MDAAVQPVPRRGQWPRRLFAVAVGLVLAFVVLEVVARARYGAPLAERLPIHSIQADASSGWRMLPGDEHYTYMHRVRVNALGLRGPEIAPKAANERRVLALGDSLIYGQGVGDDETVPAQLEAILNARDREGRRWTVVNAGHRGYDTAQELGLYEDLAEAVRPDVVVLFWFWNDVQERDILGNYARLSASGPVAFDTGRRMEGWVALKWRLKQLLRHSALIMSAYDLHKSSRANPALAEQVRSYLPKLDVHLRRLRALADQSGAEVLFAAVPDASALLSDHATREITAWAEQRARAQGLPVCSLAAGLETLAITLGAPPVLPYDGHYDGAGNRALAESVAECLLAP